MRQTAMYTKNSILDLADDILSDGVLIEARFCDKYIEAIAIGEANNVSYCPDSATRMSLAGGENENVFRDSNPVVGCYDPQSLRRFAAPRTPCAPHHGAVTTTRLIPMYRRGKRLANDRRLG